MVCYRMLFKKLEIMLFERYGINVTDNDWNEIEIDLINELENIVDTKITSHKELVNVLEKLKKLYPIKFLRLEDILKSLIREKKDALKKKQINSSKKYSKIGMEDKNNESGGKEIEKKKKKKEIDYLYY